MKKQFSRRHVLQTTVALAGLRALPAAVGGSPNRALVCIYLTGGNDSNNIIVPLRQYRAYAAARGPLATNRESLVRVTSGLDQTDYGFHPALNEVAGLFQRGALAVAANVGNLSGPVSPDPFLRYFPSGYAAPGWAAHMAGITLYERKNLFVDFPNLMAAAGKTTSMSLVSPGVTATRAMHAAVRNVALNAANHITTEFPQTYLGRQLQQAAALIKEGGSFGMQNQVFLCTQPAFSTSGTQGAQFTELSKAMAAFYAATVEIGASRNVTTYTDTEFSRTLQPNALGSSDPAWGGHNLIMGDGVLGGSVYGDFPSLNSGGPDDPSGRGIWRPSSSKEQYFATVATWFGLTPAQISNYFPAADAAAKRTLGFMVTG
jgi:uncharacterized protein (DUF1501 family)